MTHNGAILKFLNPRSALAQTPNLKLCALRHNQYKIPKPKQYAGSSTTRPAAPLSCNDAPPLISCNAPPLAYLLQFAVTYLLQITAAYLPITAIPAPSIVKMSTLFWYMCMLYRVFYRGATSNTITQQKAGQSYAK
jgi:hypothetical protein